MNYLIYAHCYPGKAKRLYMGACRYWFDSNGYVHLGTKREFGNKSGESFSPLNDCSRITFMDLKNGHFWMIICSANGRTFRWFHAKADDIANFAP